MLVFPSAVFTVLVSAASSPEGLKLGFALSSFGEGDFDPDLDRGRSEWLREERGRGEADRREDEGTAWPLSLFDRPSRPES